MVGSTIIDTGNILIANLAHDQFQLIATDVRDKLHHEIGRSKCVAIFFQEGLEFIDLVR